jgi:hypothetical protein
MQDCWYADNRDLVKWGVLLQLADTFEVQRILQVAFYRPNIFGQLVINGKASDLPAEVISQFRDVQKISDISPKVRATVFDLLFEHRATYLHAVLTLLPTFAHERCIVFLDPDTGLEPKKPGLEHVLDTEARAIWDGMKNGDVFVFYQHKTNRNGRSWIEPKRIQLANAIGVQLAKILVAHAPEIANDVVLFFTQKT